MKRLTKITLYQSKPNFVNFHQFCITGIGYPQQLQNPPAMTFDILSLSTTDLGAWGPSQYPKRRLSGSSAADVRVKFQSDTTI